MIWNTNLGFLVKFAQAIQQLICKSANCRVPQIKHQNLLSMSLKFFLD